MAPALDLVVVSTPHPTHAPLATAALAAGCHVVVDKPFAISADEARDLAALAARRGQLAIPFQNRRWDAEILTLQRLMRDGALGTCTASSRATSGGGRCRSRAGPSRAPASAARACSST